MPDQKLLRAVLRFDVEKQALKASDAAIDELQRQFQDLGKEVSNLEKQLNSTLKTGFDVKTANANLEQLRNQMALLAVDIKQKVAEQAEAAFRKVELRIQKIGQMGSEFQQLSMGFRQIEQSIMGPLNEGMRNFTSQMGIADATSRKWVLANKQVEQAQMRVGAVAAQQLLPLLEMGAKFATQLADFVERNPDLVKAALVIGVGSSGLAAVTGTLADVMQGASGMAMALKGLGLLGAGGGAAAGAAAAGGGTAVAIGGVLTAAVATAGAGIGLAIGTAAATPIANAIYKAQGREQKDIIGVAKETAQTYSRAAVIPSYLIAGKFAETLEKVGWKGGAQAVRGAVGWSAERLGGAPVAGAADVGPSAVAQKLMIPESAVKQWINMRRDIERSEIQYNKSRTELEVRTTRQLTDTETSYHDQQAKATKQFEQGRAEELNEFNFGQARSRRDLNREFAKEDEQVDEQRVDQQAKFNEESQRSEAEHLREMYRMSRDHNMTMQDAVANRDAIAAIREMQQFANQTDDAEWSYHNQQSQRQKDFKAQLAEEDDNRKVRRVERTKEFELARLDQKEDFDRRRALAKTHFDEQQTESDKEHEEQMVKMRAEAKVESDQLDQNYRDQQTLRTEAYQEQLDDLALFLGDESKLRTAYYDLALQELKDLYSGKKTLPTGLPAKTVWGEHGEQTGGYAGLGVYKPGEGGRREYEDLTRPAYSEHGGSLASVKALSSLTGSRPPITINLSYQFSGQSTDAEKNWYKNTAYHQAMLAFDRVLTEVQ